MKFKIICAILILLITFVIGKGIVTGELSHDYTRELAQLNATPTTSPYLSKCGVNEPPKIDPKMQTAVKYWEEALKGFGDDPSWAHYNCVYIDYKSFEDGSRGEFDPGNTGKIQDAKIYVNDVFKDDPIATSVILMHEFMHLEQYADDLKFGSKIDCVTSEVKAFHDEISYMLKLKETDFKLMSEKVEQMKNSKNIAEKTFAEEWNNSLDQVNAATNTCYQSSYRKGQTVFQKCIWDRIDLVIKKGVEKTPKYQESCKIGQP